MRSAVGDQGNVEVVLGAVRSGDLEAAPVSYPLSLGDAGRSGSLACATSRRRSASAVRRPLGCARRTSSASRYDLCQVDLSHQPQSFIGRLGRQLGLPECQSVRLVGG